MMRAPPKAASFLLEHVPAPTGMLPKHISAQMTYATLGLVASVAVLAVGAGAALSAHN